MKTTDALPTLGATVLVSTPDHRDGRETVGIVFELDPNRLYPAFYAATFSRDAGLGVLTWVRVPPAGEWRYV